MRRATVLACFLSLAFTAVAQQQQQRHFFFHYAFSVRNVPAHEKVELWFPAAQSGDFQAVKLVSTSGDLKLARRRERKYTDAMFHAVAGRSTKSEYHFAVTYEVLRRERIGLPHGAEPKPRLQTISARERQQFLAPDALVPVTGKLAELAAQQAQGAGGTLPRARALYDYVFRSMRYDKSGTGWGRGDAEWACDSHRGNCTDFHSLFISMARSEQIPARFEIGFQVPADKSSGQIAGYHCWADFYDAPYGWIPVDISEAWQHPEKKDYFFGALDADRIQFSLGRDLRLNPPQAGTPVNYFVYPYVEVNGKPWKDVATDFSFSDVGMVAVK